MNRQQKADCIQNLLNTYFPRPAIPLNHTSPYTLLIAVVLSARSTDAMVNRITPALFRRASTPEQMVQLSIEEIRQIIKPCGLSPQKAKAIHALSQLLIERYEGRVPQTFVDLEDLPGVGHKTASVILSQAFGIPTFPVDTHIFRCARRWGLSAGKTVEKVEKDLKKLFPEACWNALHLQIIYYARTYCPARGHQLDRCPICHILQLNN